MNFTKCCVLILAVLTATYNHPKSYDCRVSPWLSVCRSPPGGASVPPQEDKGQDLVLLEATTIKGGLTTICPEYKSSGKYFHYSRKIFKITMAGNRRMEMSVVGIAAALLTVFSF